MSDRLEQLLAKLNGVHRSGKNYVSRCPAHDDQHASLSITENDKGIILIKCHAGCPLDNICAAVKFKVSDLFPPKHQPRRVVAHHDYRDAQGTLLYQIVRYEPKGFAQRRPSGHGGWIWDMKSVIRVLYHLPKIVAADPSEFVFVVEGEKDADNLVALGCLATTNAQGAGKWSTLDDDSALDGRRVIIIPDKDPAGSKHAFDVASRLHGRAAEVRVLELPGNGKDVTDWISAGGTRDELLALAATAPLFSPDNEPPQDSAEDQIDVKGSPGRPASQATKLVALCGDIELFHDDDVGYATFPVEDHTETAQIKSRIFKRWLARQFYLQEESAAGSQALSDAIGVLEGKALFEGPQIKVHVRVAEHEGVIYLDLADTERRIIEVTTSGWRVCSNPPVRFRRPRGIQPLPMPVRGGTMRDLNRVLNLKDERSFILCIAWLLCSLRPGRPIPVLDFASEQGSGKSTTCRILRACIDPNEAPIRCSPREPRDLMLAANNGLVIALDNLSTVPDWLSDALCRLSTGGGFSTRTLYENDEEQIFCALRPVILSGIEELASRSDLLERTLRITLPTIPDNQRRTEDAVLTDFASIQPGILGALLDAASMALRRIPETHLASLPRMADFAKWVVAAEPSLPWDAGAFLAAYTDNCASAHALAIEATLIGEPFLQFARQQGHWIGKASELLKALTEIADDSIRTRREWPKRPHMLSGHLRRLAPNFRHLGINVEFERTHDGRLIKIRTAMQSSVTSVTDRHTPENDIKNGESGDANDADGDAPVTLAKTQEIPAATHRDARDAQIHGLSDGPESPKREVSDI